MSSFAHLQRRFAGLLFACGLIAGAMIFLMMLLVVANALLRFLFNEPIAGTLEITESLLTILIFLSLALTQYEGGHVRVLLLVKHFPASIRRAAKFTAMVLGVIFFAWCTYAAWGFAMKSWVMDEHEWGTIQFPLYPVKFVVVAGLLLLTIQFLFDAIAVALGEDRHETELAATVEEL